MTERWRYLAPLLLVVVVVAAFAIADTGGELSVTPSRKSVPTVGVAHEQPPEHVRWLAFGGGVEPGSNQVSIEQDLALVGELLGPGGVTLFAGGAGASPVQVLDKSDALGERGGLHRRLGDLFWPQDGRSARYRPTRLNPHGDARAETVMDTLLDALEQKSDAPLFVFVAAHGDPGERRNENLVRLWGGMPINVLDMTGLLDELEAPRPMRLVMASCFSGGFADTAFAGARAERGATNADRCGLFATTWDTEAAGCDSNPDRRAQESYFLHLLNALSGLDRDGAKAAIDLDGDGRVSLLEAHTRVRIASRSISVPTSTSERWLRHAAAAVTQPGGAAPKELVEERAVVEALSAAVGVSGLDGARAKLKALRDEVRKLEMDLGDLQIGLEVTNADLRIALLERWPVLDDAYHPDYQATLSGNERSIRAILDASPFAIAYQQAATRVRKHNLALDLLDIEIATSRRLIRAYENMAAAAKLRDHDPDAYARFMKFLNCERSPLPLSPRDASPH